MKKKIVVFEDGDAALQKMKLAFFNPKYSNNFDFEFIEHPEDIQAWIDENKSNLESVSMFICDYELYGVHGDTFVKQIREAGYKGPMLANSSDYNNFLIEAGCNLENKMNKDTKVIRGFLDGLLPLESTEGKRLA